MIEHQKSPNAKSFKQIAKECMAIWFEACLAIVALWLIAEVYMAVKPDNPWTFWDMVNGGIGAIILMAMLLPVVGFCIVVWFLYSLIIRYKNNVHHQNRRDAGVTNKKDIIKVSKKKQNKDTK